MILPQLQKVFFQMLAESTMFILSCKKLTLKPDTALSGNSYSATSTDFINFINAMIIYNLYDINGYFIDSGVGLTYAINLQNTSFTETGAGGLIITDETRDILFSWEVGIGKIWSKIPLRTSVSSFPFVYDITGGVNSTEAMWELLMSKASIFYW